MKPVQHHSNGIKKSIYKVFTKIYLEATRMALFKELLMTVCLDSTFKIEINNLKGTDLSTKDRGTNRFAPLRFLKAEFP